MGQGIEYREVGFVSLICSWNDCNLRNVIVSISLNLARETRAPFGPIMRLINGDQDSFFLAIHAVLENCIHRQNYNFFCTLGFVVLKLLALR